MNLWTCLVAAFALSAGLGHAGTVRADEETVKKGGPEPGGRIFAIQGEYLYDSFGIGMPFGTCFTFDAGVAVSDGLLSGIRDAPILAARGTQNQNTVREDGGRPATAADKDGLASVQSGAATAKGVGKLEAYTVVYLQPFGIIAQIMLTGYAVDECPYDP